MNAKKRKEFSDCDNSLDEVTPLENNAPSEKKRKLNHEYDSLPQNPDLLNEFAEDVVHLKKSQKPLSLEELYTKNKKAEEELNQPKFMSRQQRKEERKKLMESMKQKPTSVSAPISMQQSIIPHSSPVLNEKEVEDIKQDYMGVKEKKKRAFSSGEKTKFVFDWDASEDTSRDLNPLYDKPHEAVLLFGRGKRAGIDLREQRKQAQIYEDASLQKTTSLYTSTSKLKKHLDLDNEATHWSQKKLEEMTERDWRIFKEDYEIVTKGGRVPNPIRNWKESGLPQNLLKAIETAGYKEPTAIQRACIPIAMKGRDIIGLSQTGSGKTAAFVLPMLHYISKLPKMTPEMYRDGPYALVLVPARELALQIEAEANKFAKAMGIKVFSIIGGREIENQATKIFEGFEILIATPGRLIDCLEHRYVVLNQCNYVVLDEADQMMNMGFEDDVVRILDSMPYSNLRPETEDGEQHPQQDTNYRQTIMFSATMPPSVEKIANKYLRQRILVTVGEVGQAAERVQQIIEFVKSDGEKRNRLFNVLDEEEGKVMVFVNQKKDVDAVTRDLDNKGYSAAGLHSGKSQESREIALEGFKSGRYQILVCTNVAGRGIDVQNVALVVNYDLPATIQDYVHRIGRTGRAGKAGRAISFLTNEDTAIMYDLRELLESTKNIVPLELQNHDASKRPPPKTSAPKPMME